MRVRADRTTAGEEPAAAERLIELVGLRLDGYGRDGNQAAAASALRAAGITSVAPAHRIIDSGDITPPEQSAERGPNGLVNEAAILWVAGRLAVVVAASVSAGRFPLVFGGDCSALLGSVRGARDAAGSVGLVHVDGHEDTTPIDASEDGEAANSEIGILLGTVGRSMSAAARAGLPALVMSGLALVGQRDDEWRRALNLGSLEQLGAWKRDSREVAADPEGTARAAVAHVRAAARAWWLHVDVDVLDPEGFPAQGLPGYPDEPGGLTRDELLRVVRSAAAERGCVGASIAIYDPEQDPDGSGARFVVDLARALVEHLGG